MGLSAYYLAVGRLHCLLAYGILFTLFFGTFQSSCQSPSTDEDRLPILDDSRAFIKVKDRVLFKLEYADGLYAVAGKSAGGSSAGLGGKLCQMLEGKSAKPFQNLVQLSIADEAPVLILDSILNELRSVGLGVVFQNAEDAAPQAMIYMPQIPKTFLNNYTSESAYFPSQYMLQQCLKSGTAQSSLGQVVKSRPGPPGLPPPPPNPSAVYDSIKFLLDFEKSGAFMNAPAVILSSDENGMLINHKAYNFSEAATTFKSLIANGPQHIMIVMQPQQTKLDFVKLCDFVNRYKQDNAANEGGRMQRHIITHLTLTDQAINKANR